MSSMLYINLEIILKIVELLLYLVTMILIMELVTFIPILYSFYKEDCNETIGELIGYEESDGFHKGYWDFQNKEWIFRKKTYYSMVVNYIVNGKNYQNIEKIGRRGIIFRKKTGSKIKIIYKVSNPIDSTIKYSFTNKIILFCVLGLIYMILKVI